MARSRDWQNAGIVVHMSEQPVTLETIARQLDLNLKEARLARELSRQVVPIIEATNAQVGGLDAKLVAMGDELTATIRSVLRAEGQDPGQAA